MSGVGLGSRSRGGNRCKTRGKALERLNVPDWRRRAPKETDQGREIRGDRSGGLATDHEMIRAEVRGFECLERGAPEHEALRVYFADGVDVGAERGVLENFEAHAGEHLSQ